MTIERWTGDHLDQFADAVDGLREFAMSNNRNIDILVGIATGQQERFASVLELIPSFCALLNRASTHPTGK